MKRSDLPPAPPEVLREQQLRDAGRGCLLVLVLEGAALLAGVLWVGCQLLDLDRLGTAAAVAFFAFTAASAGVLLLMVILGNTPRQRRIREQTGQAAQEAGRAADGAKSVADGPTGE